MEKLLRGRGGTGIFLGKCLLCSYLLTAVLLLLLALLLYKLGLSEGAASVAMIIVYVAATFAGGFLAGKKMQKRKYLWGLLVGALYFAVLFFLSLITHFSGGAWRDSFLSTLILCLAGGALGGMLG